MISKVALCLSLTFIASVLVGLQRDEPSNVRRSQEDALDREVKKAEEEKRAREDAAKAKAATPSRGESAGLLGDFVLSWDLFHNAYLAGWFIGLMLSIIGVVVVARDQIFIGASVSQASTLGVAVGMWIGQIGQTRHVQMSDAFLSFMAVAFAIIAALVTSRGGGVGRESYESITGWVFLLASSASILILAHSPHGLEEIHRLISSSIIGASTSDVWTFLSLAVLSFLLYLFLQRRLILFAMDPAMATAVGMRTTLWSLGLSAWLGLVVALSIRSAGALFAFGCLVLPALVAKNVCREVRHMFIVAPIAGLAACVIAFVLANHFDFPPAQVGVALMCVALMASWTFRSVRSRFSVA